jgi:polyisoprenoid-binding protein YceI
MRLMILTLVTLMTGSGALAIDNYKVDPDHSTVIFKAVHFGTSHTYGRFTKVSGDFKWDDKDVSKDAVDFDIATDSLNTDVEKRDKHLKSPDFLDTKQFPTITFKSDRVKKNGDKNYDIEGKLTLHGVTKPIKITWTKIGEGKDMGGNYRLGGEAHFTIKRTDYGIKFMVPAVADEIDLIVAVEGIKGK